MKDGVESLGRVRAQALVLLTIAFLAGAFVGGTIERVMARPSRQGLGLRGGPGRGPGGPGGPGGPRTPRGPGSPRAPGALPASYEALGLSADQRAKLESILAKRSARVDSAMKIACTVIGPARDSTSKEADAILTADQRHTRDSVRAARLSPRGTLRFGPFGCALSPAQAPRR